MFPFVVWKVLFQIPRRLPWDTQFYFIIRNQTIFIFTAFYISNFIMIVFIPNIIYCIITIWNFRSINNFSILIPDIIILYFWKDSNVYPDHTFSYSKKFLTFTDSFFILSFLKNELSRSFFYFFMETCVYQH